MAHLRSSLILFVFLAACGETTPPALAEIDTVGPEVLEPGDVLRITGNGFVEGPCTVTFDGTFTSHGIRGRTDRAVQVKGTAVSERLIEIPMNPKTVRKLVEEPVLFEGRIVVDFPLKESAVRISAQKKGMLFSLSPGGLGVTTAAKRLRQAEATLRTLGVDLGNPRGQDGLVVATVQPKSAAQRAGIEFGDRVLAIDGRTVVEVADFSVVDPKTAHRIELVNRMGIIRETAIAPVLPGTLDNDELTAVVLTCVALGMFLAFAAPRRGRDPLTMVMSSDPFTQAVLVGTLSAPLALVPAIALLAFDGISLLLALFACQGIALAMLVLISTGRGVLAMVPRFLVIPIVVGVAAFQSSALGMNDIVASQQHASFGPHCLSSPFSFLLTLFAVSLIWPGRRELLGRNEYRHRLKRALRWIAAAASACIVSACLLGGWGGPFVSVDQMARDPLCLLAGTSIFIVKTWLVLAGFGKMNCIPW